MRKIGVRASWAGAAAAMPIVPAHVSTRRHDPRGRAGVRRVRGLARLTP